MSDSRWYNSEEFDKLIEEQDNRSGSHISADFKDNQVKTKYIKGEEF